MIKKIIIVGSCILNFCLLVQLIQKNKQVKSEKKIGSKYCMFFELLNRWMKAKKRGKNIQEYLIDNNIKKVGIYGMGDMGGLLVNELKETDVEVVFGIDKAADTLFSEIPLKKPEDDYYSVDAIIVTAITFYEDIEAFLKTKVKCKILNLEDLVYQL